MDRGPARDLLADHPAEFVVRVCGHAAEVIGPGGDLSGGVEAVGDGAAVEVGLGHEPVGPVVPVRPDEPPSEGIAFQAGGAAVRGGHLHRAARLVAAHDGGDLQGIGDRRQETGLVVGVADGTADGIGDRRAVSPLVELLESPGAVRIVTLRG